jgi:hypothetical protein
MDFPLHLLHGGLLAKRREGAAKDLNHGGMEGMKVFIHGSSLRSSLPAPSSPWLPSGEIAGDEHG